MIDAAEGDAPSRDMWFIAIAASAGGLTALFEVLSGLPADLGAAVAIVQHRVPATDTNFESLLGRRTRLPIKAASDGVFVQSGVVYIAPSDRHLTVAPDGRFSHEGGFRVHELRAAADPLF